MDEDIGTRAEESSFDGSQTRSAASDENVSGAAGGGQLDLRRMRAARNQVLFREVNERLNEINAAFGHLLPVGEFVCECSDGECSERIGLTRDEYEEIRTHPAWFAVRKGHENPELETVVEERTEYNVVETQGSATALVTRLNPRDRSPEDLRRRPAR